MSVHENPSRARRASSRPLWQWVAPLIAVSSLLAATACGGGNGGEGGDGDGHQGDGGNVLSPEQAFRVALGDAYCGALTSCCSGPFDAADCKAYTTTDTSFFPTEVTAVTGAFDPTAAAACLATMTAAAKCQVDPKLVLLARDACQKVYPGSRQLGEPCTQGADCVAPPFGTRICDAESKCASLATQIVAQEGEPCAGEGSPLYVCDLSKHLWCEKSSGTCRAPLAAGADCDNGSGDTPTCADGGYACIPVNGAPRCARAHEAGESCWSPECDFAKDPAQCACGAGFVCDGLESHVCEAASKIGDACTDGFDALRCPGACMNGRCVDPSAALTWAPYCH